MEKKDNWKDIFCRQVSTGKFWKNLFKDDFDEHDFLDRSDAVFICKKAQADIYENIISKMTGKIEDTHLNEIKTMLDNHWKNSDDDSALGM